MSQSGLHKGLAQGVLQGVKTGYAMSSFRSGFRSGITDGIANSDKLQDPENLVASKLPLLHWNAENCSVNASNNVLTVTNLSNQSSPPTFAVGSDPNRAGGDVYGNKSALTFDTTDYIASSGTPTGFSECTIMLVFNLNSTSTTDLCTYVFSTFGSTLGDIYIQSLNGNQIQSYLGGNGGAGTTSVWNTPANLIQGEWYILTAKYRLFAVNGPGSEQEVYINGTKQNIIPVTTTFGTGLTTDTFGSLGATPFYFGGNPSQTRGGNAIAAGLVFTYWLNESEQIRLENYLKKYYGYKF